jgi:hypothetical protein
MLNIVTLNQFSKLPLFFQHFIEHQQQDERMTLLDFMSMHYWGHDIKDNDDKKDQQLPFKNMSVNTILTFTHPTPILLTFPEHVFYNKVNNPDFRQHFVPDGIVTTLLRPPTV